MFAVSDVRDLGQEEAAFDTAEALQEDTADRHRHSKRLGCYMVGKLNLNYLVRWCVMMNL